MKRSLCLKTFLHRSFLTNVSRKLKESKANGYILEHIFKGWWLYNRYNIYNSIYTSYKRKIKIFQKKQKTCYFCLTSFFYYGTIEADKEGEGMYKIVIHIEKESKVIVAEYIVKDKDLKTILDFCERQGYLVASIKKMK